MYNKEGVIMKNKKVLIAIIVAILLIGIVGVTFAAYTYSRMIKIIPRASERSSSRRREPIPTP